MPAPSRVGSAILFFAAAGCAPAGSSSTANDGAGLPAELVFCRRSPTVAGTAEIAVRTAQNLGSQILGRASGRELHVRAHPGGQAVVFARERTPGNAASRDLFLADLVDALPETRLTDDATADDSPSWSPDGGTVLFSSARAGERRLYTIAADGSGLQPFLAAPTGAEDLDPRWGPMDRIVFVRRQQGQSQLFLVQGDGTGLVPLGAPIAAPTSELGIREPALAPDGSNVVFVEALAAGSSRLCVVSVQTGQKAVLFDPQGEVRLPCHAPQQDRIYCGIAQPAQGRADLRLCELPLTGGVPRLIEPGEQWILGGVDVLPALAPARPLTAPEDLPQSRLEVQVSSGVVTSGGKSQLAAADQQPLSMATSTFEGREIASILCKWTLPVDEVAELAALHFRCTVACSRSGGGSFVRATLYNPVARRYDTIAERQDPGTGWSSLEFTTQSLAHVTLERQVRIGVIVDLEPGSRAEFRIDEAHLELQRFGAVAGATREGAPLHLAPAASDDARRRMAEGAPAQQAPSDAADLPWMPLRQGR